MVRERSMHEGEVESIYGFDGKTRKEGIIRKTKKYARV
jgi:hypothetical protein